MSITAVHPMREDAVNQFLARDHLVEVDYDGNRFYLRRFVKPGVD